MGVMLLVLFFDNCWGLFLFVSRKRMKNKIFINREGFYGGDCEQ